MAGDLTTVVIHHVHVYFLRTTECPLSAFFSESCTDDFGVVSGLIDNHMS